MLALQFDLPDSTFYESVEEIRVGIPRFLCRMKWRREMKMRSAAEGRRSTYLRQFLVGSAECYRTHVLSKGICALLLNGQAMEGLAHAITALG